ncbi:MAG: YesL family protein, partial [Clostridiales bacterium]|nr:YesL family protein [Clostridiales bacterium]
MGGVIGGLLDNDSAFGKIMTRCGILIGANVMFVIFSIPVVTIGPAWTALHFVMMKTLQSEDGVVNP